MTEPQPKARPAVRREFNHNYLRPDLRLKFGYRSAESLQRQLKRILETSDDQ